VARSAAASAAAGSAAEAAVEAATSKSTAESTAVVAELTNSPRLLAALSAIAVAASMREGLTLVHFAAQLGRFLWDGGCV